MTADRLYNEAALARFYDLDNGWGADFDFCVKLAETARSVMDLGCGTGQLAAALSETCEVTGVDPAGPMLDIARQRPGGAKVAWIEADARELDLGRGFDLVLLTGHAFQVFQTPDDQAAVLGTIARHLAPGGRFIFDSRNPAAEAWREWSPEVSRHEIEHATLGPVEAWNDAAWDAAGGIVTYETHYRIKTENRAVSASSQIRFTRQEELARLIGSAGLRVESWLGSWQGEAYSPSSREIIPLGRRHEASGSQRNGGL